MSTPFPQSNEYISLFIPETSSFPKEEYLEELKSFIYKIMNSTIEDLIQDQMTHRLEDNTLHINLRKYIEDRIGNIYSIWKVYLTCIDSIDKSLFLVNESKLSISNMITKGNISDKLSKLHETYENIKKSKIIKDSPLVLVLKVPGTMLNHIKNMEYKEYLRCKSYMTKYFSERNEEIRRITTSKLSISSVPVPGLKFIIFLEEVYNKTESYCRSFLSNKVKQSKSLYELNEHIYDILFPIEDFQEEKIKSIFNQENSQEYKIFVLICYKFEIFNEDFQKIQQNPTEKVRNLDDLVVFQETIEKLEEKILVFFQFLSDFSKKFPLKHKENQIFSFINKNYLINILTFYINYQYDNNHDSNSYEIINFTENSIWKKVNFLKTSSFFLNFQKKLVFLKKIHKNPTFFLDFNNNLICKLILDFYLFSLCLIEKILLKQMLFNRGEIGKFIKIDKEKKEDNERNDHVCLLFTNLKYLTIVIKGFDYEFIELSYKVKAYKAFIDFIIKVTSNINEYMIENGVLFKINTRSADFCLDLTEFKRVFFNVIDYFYDEILCIFEFHESISVIKEKNMKIDEVKRMFIWN